MEGESLKCPNCAAPVDLELGEVEALCSYCASRLRFIPEQEELEVVRTREEMKYRERVAVQKAILRKQLDQEEAEKWRQMAGKVAISALPVVGETAGRALFGAALDRGKGCGGCGCAILAAIVLAALMAAGALG